MKRLCLALLLTLLAAPAFAQQTVPEISFESVPDFFKYPPEVSFGEVTSVAVNSQGHIFVMSHSDISGHVINTLSSQVLEFDPQGNYLRTIGKGVYGMLNGHSVRFDRDDNLWVVDRVANVIMRFNREGHVTMVLGHRVDPTVANELLNPLDVIAGKYPPPTHVDNLFYWPTDIAWDAAGNMYISDGYANSRVAKFDKNGDWIKSWGSRGSDPGQFRVPHNIGVDRQGNVYVADRENQRIQIFNGDGNFLRMIKIDVPIPAGARNPTGNTPTNPSTTIRPVTICITTGPTQYLYTNDGFPGRIYKLTLDGKLLGMFGKSGRQLKQFSAIHGMACPAENELFVADMNNWRVQKLILHP